MGYDMRMVEDPTDQEAYALARKKFNEACSARDALPDNEKGTFNVDHARLYGFEDQRSWDGRSERYVAAQKAVDDAYHEVDKTDVGYFHLNIWGMQVCRQAMLERQMAHAVGNHPEWPEVPDGIEDPWDEDNARPEAVEFRAANNAVLSYATPDIPGIPIWKFGSNDGWIVTPIEIRGALAMLEKSDASAPLHECAPVTWWDEWVAWLRVAAEHGGFRVY